MIAIMLTLKLLILATKIMMPYMTCNESQKDATLDIEKR